MLVLLLIVLSLVAVWMLAYVKASLPMWTGAFGVVLFLTTILVTGLTWLMAPAWIVWGLFALLNIPVVRLKLFSSPLLSFYRRALPAMSSTEREALEAGSVWWDGELFSGQPNWRRLLDLPAPSLSEEEQAFLDGPTEELCAMLNDWQITHELCALPDSVWRFIKEKGFLGMIIPKSSGGLGFSAQTHSAVVAKIASRSGSAAVSVMVPNSLGPAELLMRYGTEEQKAHYLPRLAYGQDVPCFGLTNPYAGSDAAAIPDYAVICRGEYQGEQVLGMRVTWEKRYITLGPVATVLGLAFRAYDPEHLLGDSEDIGITLALIPTSHPGVNIGRRHYPGKQAFQNGPNSGKDVFIPMDMVIGGQERVGQGWRMLMNCLAVGRSISLPALSAAGAKFCARTTGAYARIRKQFKVPIGKFEGVEEAMARIAGEAYAVDAAREVTACALDQKQEPSVISALLKYQATERQRKVVNDAMDVHGGRAICEGPSNYLSNVYQSIPVGITVEGANILTRTLIIFGQGAIRCHPWLMKEMEAARDSDHEKALPEFDQALGGHISFILNNAARTLLYNLSGGRWTDAPEMGPVSHWYGQVERVCVTFALVADAALLLLGGALKRREKLSGRFADILGEMYFMSCCLKRFEDQGRPADDLPLVEWACQNSLYNIQNSLDGILSNFPSRPVAWLLRVLVFPTGRRIRPSSDDLGHKLAAMLMEPSEARDRLTAGIYTNSDPEDCTGILEYALEVVPKAEPIEQKVTEAIKAGRLSVPVGESRIVAAKREGVITAQEAELLEQADEVIRKVIDVDDFDPAELTRANSDWQEASITAEVA